ncbi:MAG: glycosyltransferase family 4 protein [Deltaproteobacteria bacterium]|nr:glycosyltransferase family 4 protein [Deltaproteobacteria bacterium]
MSIRVLHFASGDAWGGAERVIETLVRSMQSNAEVACLLLNEGRLADVIRDMGIAVVVIPERGMSLRNLAREVRTALRRLRFDVIHCHRDKELLLALIARRGSTTPVVITVHGLAPSAQLSLLQVVRTWGILLLARCFGVGFAAVSRELADRLGRWPLAVRAVEIPNPMPSVGSGEGMPDLRMRFGWDPGRPLVGFIGRLETVKGPDLFLEIARRGSARFGWVVVGSGSMEKTLADRCQAEGLGDRVRFLGSVPEAAPLLRQLDALAMTSRHEGTPMALLEAAVCEVPVVAFGVGGIPALLEHAPSSWCVPPGDLDAFARALDGLLESPESARRAAAAWAASIRPRYAQGAVRDAYLALYARCAGSRSVPAERRPTRDLPGAHP